MWHTVPRVTHFSKRFHPRSEIPQSIVAPRSGMYGLPDEQGTKRQLSRLCDHRSPIPRMLPVVRHSGPPFVRTCGPLFLVARSSEVRVACAISIVGCDLQYARMARGCYPSWNFGVVDGLCVLTWWGRHGNHSNRRGRRASASARPILSRKGRTHDPVCRDDGASVGSTRQFRSNRPTIHRSNDTGRYRSRFVLGF